jgi:hypothetical protein
MTFEEWRDKKGFPVTSTQQPLFRECWQAAQAEAREQLGRDKARGDRDEQQRMIDDCETRSSKMSDWESDFIDSLSKQMAQGRTLSAKQCDVLDKIWEKVT